MNSRGHSTEHPRYQEEGTPTCRGRRPRTTLVYDRREATIELDLMYSRTNGIREWKFLWYYQRTENL